MKPTPMMPNPGETGAALPKPSNPIAGLPKPLPSLTTKVIPGPLGRIYGE